MATGDGDYVDLLNGQRSYEPCEDASCRKRISLFMALIATEDQYQLYFSSAPPQQLQLEMINAIQSNTANLVIHYSLSSRYYKDEQTFGLVLTI